MSEKETPQNQLKKLIHEYCMSTPQTNEEKELEVKYGLGENKITKTQFDNTINKLKQSGFLLMNNEGDYMLRINPMTRGRNGYFNQSYVRIEINEINNIQKYCKTDYFDIVNIPDYINIIQKKLSILGKDKKTGKNIYQQPVDFYNSNFRVNYKIEHKLSEEEQNLKNILKDWTSSKKIYRYIKRYRFKIPSTPFEIHCSIVKTSRQRKVGRGRSVYVEESNIQDSNVFNNPETYEIELEFNPDAVDELGTIDQREKGIMNIIKRYTKLLLSGLQNTNYPIKYDEQTQVLKEYLKLTHRNKTIKDVKTGKTIKLISLEELLKDPSNKRRKNRKNFIGPSTVSLEMKHIIETNNEDIANINNLYTVTEKADGERHLMYINEIGKIYLLDINLNVKFTGCTTGEDKLHNSIFDGELVLNNKEGEFINRFLIFDLYISNKKDFRQYPFMSTDVIKKEMKYKNPEIDKNKFRYIEMRKLIKMLNDSVKSIVYNKDVPMIFKMKTFENNLQESIFVKCNTILDKVKSLDYETDGLIFTPIDKSVGSDSITINHSTQKTWEYSLKWKPPIHNTVDFLVTTKKSGNKDFIGNLYEKGVNVKSNSSVKKYKTLELRVGYSQYRHGFLNPLDRVIKNQVKRVYDYRDIKEYKPVLFYPTNPTPQFPICFTNILLSNEGNKQYLKIENGKEIFDDDMIIECRFDHNRPEGWQWIPIKVRHDKTAAYKKGDRNFGNDYRVANSVWSSINNPITENMIRTKKNIPDYIDDDTVYYSNDKKSTATISLRNFHNKYVKFKLINHMTKPNQNLFDMSVGKGGDLHKWIQAKLNAVVGIDYSVDNIENQLDGACSRYLQEKQKKTYIPKAMFLSGDSSKNIKNGSAFGDKQKNKLIMKAIYGEGSRDPKEIGVGVSNLFGIGEKGFDIISNQFSTHYFFKNKQTLLEFCKNLSENCKVGGYIVGTCYDGNRIFDLLKNKNPRETVIKKNSIGETVWKITKMYEGSEISDDESSLGLEIDVFQESINKTHTEFIVNFNYFTKILESFGFIPCPKDELSRFGLDNPIGSFKNLFELMKTDIAEGKFHKKNIGKALDMSEGEKFVSFLNNYYIYKKKRNVNLQTVENSLNNVKDAILPEEIKLHQSIVDSSTQTYRDYVIKYKRKVIIN